MMGLLKLLRVVNLPTVPGDVLVGLALVAWVCPAAAVPFSTVVGVALASMGVYLFALADNDIVGASTDGLERPIPAGEISLRTARVARAALLAFAFLAAAWTPLPLAGWIVLAALVILSAFYNRRRNALVMGLCRALNVLLGASVLVMSVSTLSVRLAAPLALAALMWTVFIAAVTRYSRDEDAHPEKRACVSQLIGALVYLQLIVLLAVYLLSPTSFSRALLLAGAVLLICQRLLKSILPKVSGS